MDEGSGFLSRWARRKAAARSGAVAPEAAPATPPTAPPVTRPIEPPAVTPMAPEARGIAPASAPEATAPAEPPPPTPTMDDVAKLTPEADFGRFVARDVDPGVRNAAMKKLFSDPHYNVMDGLDIYIDDYGKPDPIPPGMLRSLAQSRLLGLFDDTPEDQPDAAARGVTTDHAPATAESTSAPDRTHDEDPDLQLQPDDAAGARSGEPGGPHAGGDAAGER
jgi:hypothetical protein